MFGFEKMFFQRGIPLGRTETFHQNRKMETKQIHSMVWRGIPISIFYQPDYSQGYKKIIGEAIAHLEIKAEEPLPFSRTGYRSHFLPFSKVEQHGGAILLVESWLEESSQSAEWKQYTAEKNQLQLF